MVFPHFIHTSRIGETIWVFSHHGKLLKILIHILTFYNVWPMDNTQYTTSPCPAMRKSCRLFSGSKKRRFEATECQPSKFSHFKLPQCTNKTKLWRLLFVHLASCTNTRRHGLALFTQYFELSLISFLPKLKNLLPEALWPQNIMLLVRKMLFLPMLIERWVWIGVWIWQVADPNKCKYSWPIRVLYLQSISIECFQNTSNICISSFSAVSNLANSILSSE